MKKSSIVFLLCALQPLAAYFVSDNRYIPAYDPTFIWSDTVEKPLFSGIRPSVFFINAYEAYGSGSKDKRMIPEVFGNYDQKVMNDALVTLGQTTPLLAQWQIQLAIPWQVKQRLEGFGLKFCAQYAVSKYFAVGVETGVMRVLSDQDFLLPRSTVRDMGLLPSQEIELDRERRAMFQQLGLLESQWSGVGPLDTTIYARCGKSWEYEAKFRQVSLGLYGGVILPTGLKRDASNTASFFFSGSNGAAGFFVGTHNQFELKEDMVVGLQLEISNRASKIVSERLPALEKENYLFGALQGDVKIDPGVTAMFKPSFMMGNLRDGFDIGISYALVTHGGDVWRDVRTTKTTASNINGMYAKSHWKSEYLSLTVLYDSGKVVKRSTAAPRVYLTWDIPVHMIGAHEVSRTHAIGLGIEVNF